MKGPLWWEASAPGAALYSIGIPKDSIINYEMAVKADKFLVIAHGTPEQVRDAHRILDLAGASEAVIHQTDAASAGTR